MSYSQSEASMRSMLINIKCGKQNTRQMCNVRFNIVLSLPALTTMDAEGGLGTPGGLGAPGGGGLGVITGAGGGATVTGGFGGTGAASFGGSTLTGSAGFGDSSSFGGSSIVPYESE